MSFTTLAAGDRQSHFRVLTSHGRKKRKETITSVQPYKADEMVDDIDVQSGHQNRGKMCLPGTRVRYNLEERSEDPSWYPRMAIKNV